MTDDNGQHEDGAPESVEPELNPQFEVKFDPEMSNLVRHARRELKVAGVPEEDQKVLLGLVEEFAKHQMSGGEAGWYIHVLVRLLQFENLTELTDVAHEWQLVGGSEEANDATWQSVRNPEAFSKDGGKTYYLLSENPNPQRPDKIHVSRDHMRMG